ncbi:phosphotransferase family protein [Sandaracinobacter sp. RS1-74]|uniref:phosphotransferase family protein n=1 Tax=Sandaracinobacteroides sayramensis TaxID=2913411 RepID=UPI001ED9F4DF|nr:phosphotransferase family protein [Sandaracinobacteroides sayramensis]MCG2839360.1 phosphotransferase family protein [Sandaracinobacteroides sayramensis]
MSSRQEQFSGTTEVREGARFDEAALERWMRGNVRGFEGPLEVRQFKGGQSNPTYKLVTPGRSYVLRRKPPGQLLKSAHAVDREYRVITALFAQGFPVAESFGLCTDESVIGTWFYVMENVDGRIIWDGSFPDVPTADRRRYFEAMNDTIAHLHSIDPVKAGLEDFGKPGNYFTRQIGRWSQQYLDDSEAGRVPEMDRLVEWLPANIPGGDESAIVHGDYRCDNMIFHPTEPKVLAVLDWELSTLGHPLADFSYHLMMYRMPAMGTVGLSEVNLAEMNIPSEADYIERYCRTVGRDPLEVTANMDFYVAYNMFRLAAILHGIKGRVLRGNASNAHAKAMAANVEPLAKLAWAQALKGGASQV